MQSQAPLMKSMSLYPLSPLGLELLPTTMKLRFPLLSMLFIIACLNSCLPPGAPRGHFPKDCKTKKPIHIYAEEAPSGKSYWIDTAKAHFLPNNQRCSEIAFLPSGSSVKIFKVWSPLELMAPGDFKMRWAFPHKEKHIEIEMWITTGDFNCYFTEHSTLESHSAESMNP